MINLGLVQRETEDCVCVCVKDGKESSSPSTGCSALFMPYFESSALLLPSSPADHHEKPLVTTGLEFCLDERLKNQFARRGPYRGALAEGLDTMPPHFMASMKDAFVFRDGGVSWVGSDVLYGLVDEKISSWAWEWSKYDN